MDKNQITVAGLAPKNRQREKEVGAMNYMPRAKKLLVEVTLAGRPAPVAQLSVSANPSLAVDERLAGIAYHAYFAAKGQGRAPAFAQAAWSQLTTAEKVPWLIVVKAVLAAADKTVRHVAQNKRVVGTKDGSFTVPKNPNETPARHRNQTRRVRRLH
jgi:hypothetical protein